MYSGSYGRWGLQFLACIFSNLLYWKVKGTFICLNITKSCFNILLQTFATFWKIYQLLQPWSPRIFSSLFLLFQTQELFVPKYSDLICIFVENSTHFCMFPLLHTNVTLWGIWKSNHGGDSPSMGNIWQGLEIQLVQRTDFVICYSHLHAVLILIM